MTGPGAGHLRSPDFLTFTGVENLVGGANNQDTFVIEQGGSLPGTVEGGAGGYDTVVFRGAYGRVDYEVTGPQSGDVALDGQTVRYAGMEPIEFLTPVEDFTFTGTTFDDTITLHDVGGTDGVMEIFGTTSILGIETPFKTVRFANPTESLKIEGKIGRDIITVQSVDAAFSAELLIYGNHPDAPTLVPDVLLPFRQRAEGLEGPDCLVVESTHHRHRQPRSWAGQEGRPQLPRPVPTSSRVEGHSHRLRDTELRRATHLCGEGRRR